MQENQRRPQEGHDQQIREQVSSRTVHPLVVQSQSFEQLSVLGSRCMLNVAKGEPIQRCSMH